MRHEAVAQTGGGQVDPVAGERGDPIVSRARSLQSRMNSLLAAALMISVGAAMLAWYYAKALSRPTRTQAAAHASLPASVGEGVTLPSFVPLARQPSTAPAPSDARDPLLPTVAALRSCATGPCSQMSTLPAQRLLEPPLGRAPPGLQHGNGAPAPLSPRQEALARRLSGGVLAARGSPAGATAEAADMQPPTAPPLAAADERASKDDELQKLLQPRVLRAVGAEVLPTQRLLLPKGTFIDCTLETAIDSTLPGMTTCVTATDTFGADGTVVLLERGTKLIGETRGQVHQGQARIFVVWTEARTPTGVVVRLDSPGTDALGRSGLQGKVNRHFWQRFGAALLVSTIDGAVQYEVQSASRGGAVVLDPTASEDVLTEILRGTVDIAPTIRVRNGARIQVLVARDVDFRSVYELQAR